MEENINAPGLVGFVEKNYLLIKRIELISFVIFILGFLFYELNVANSNIILIVGIIATAISLFLQAFKMIEFEDLESYNLLGAISFINFIYKFTSVQNKILTQKRGVGDTPKRDNFTIATKTNPDGKFIFIFPNYKHDSPSTIY